MPTAADKAIDLQPNLVAPSAMLGLSCYELYDPCRTLGMSRGVLRLRPNDTKVLLHLAKTYRKLGRKAKAGAEIVRFQDLAKMKWARREALSRELMTSAL